MPTNGIESFSFLSKLGINSRWSLLRSYLVKLGGFFGIVYFLKVFFAVGIRTSTVIKQSRKNLMINGWSISPKRPGRFFLQPSSSSLSSKKRRKIPIIKNVKKNTLPGRRRIDVFTTPARLLFFSLRFIFVVVVVDDVVVVVETLFKASAPPSSSRNSVAKHNGGVFKCADEWPPFSPLAVPGDDDGAATDRPVLVAAGRMIYDTDADADAASAAAARGREERPLW